MEKLWKGKDWLIQGREEGPIWLKYREHKEMSLWWGWEVPFHTQILKAEFV